MYAGSERKLHVQIWNCNSYLSSKPSFVWNCTLLPTTFDEDVFSQQKDCTIVKYLPELITCRK